MKRKQLLSFITIIALVLLISGNVFAERIPRVYDSYGSISAQDLSKLNQEADSASAAVGADIIFCLIGSTQGKGVENWTASYCSVQDFSSSVLCLAIDMEQNVYYFYTSGSVSSIIGYSEQTALWNAFMTGNNDAECVSEYISKAYEILAGSNYGGGGTTDHPSRLIDEVDVLTASEEANVLASLDAVSEKRRCDVAVVLVNSTGGRDISAFADDYYDYNGYGYGASGSGIMLVISLGDSSWAISTAGYGITAFNDAAQQYLMDKITPYLSSGDFERGFIKYAETCDELLKMADEGHPYGTNNGGGGGDDDDVVNPAWLGGSLGIGALGSAIWMGGIKSSHKTVSRKRTANNYFAGQPIVDHGNDVFLYNEVSRVRKPRQDNGSRRGHDENEPPSTTHKSSSGRTHGGSQGRF